MFLSSKRLLINGIFFMILCSMVIGCSSSARSHYMPRPIDESCVVILDASTEISKDPTYGFTVDNAVRVGGGPENEYIYLSQLLGPNGKSITGVDRQGSTSTTYTDGRILMIDIYTVFIENKPYEKKVYIDMYNCESPKILKGFSSRPLNAK
jgi:hypothetical protein